ncbi:hypothetical protein GGR51DRAFT_564772 [Nemania sp. FL0031]|nr:hypothetical protein GGR51DRAFT_564772 [Nemania sp. FL0031]
MAERTPITVLFLSQNRSFVRDIDKCISRDGFKIGGVLESDPFSESELEVALRVIEPRPRVLFVGREYTKEEREIADKIFYEYKKEVGVEGHLVKINSKDIEDHGLFSQIIETFAITIRQFLLSAYLGFTK